MAVLDMHFSWLLKVMMPIIADGYEAYRVCFEVLQRCWVHLLREAQKYAIKGGEKGKEGYFRLCMIYKSVVNRDTAPAPDCLDLERKACEIAISVYGQYLSLIHV